MNFFERLFVGWWWFGQCFEEWYWCMTHAENNGGDFFCHLCSDYVGYIYYTKYVKHAK
jgi:hypothetical protein